jgi:threonyl-tRNA synthetase
MPTITLPDGSQRSFDHPVSVAEVAASIGAGLAKATVAGKVDGKLVDACDIIDHDATLQIITPKMKRGWRSSATLAPTWSATRSSSCTRPPRW